MGAIARRILCGHNSGGRLGRRLLEAKIPKADGPKADGPEADGPEAAIGRPGATAKEAEVIVRGVIRSGDVPILTRYGMAYGLYDYPTAGYDCVLKSDVYRLGEYVGDYVEVTGALADVSKELPVMYVVRLQLLKLKWMR